MTFSWDLPYPSQRSPLLARNVVATSQPLAAQAGLRMLLKGDGLQPVGYLEIRAQPNFEVEIANCDAGGNVLAKVLLVASGEIRLTPAASARVVIDGDAETDRGSVRQQPIVHLVDDQLQRPVVQRQRACNAALAFACSGSRSTMTLQLACRALRTTAAMRSSTSGASSESLISLAIATRF